MFWSFVSRKVRKSTDLPALQNQESGVLCYEPEELAEEAVGYLKKIFTGTEGGVQVEGEAGGMVDEGEGEGEAGDGGGAEGEDRPGYWCGFTGCGRGFRRVLQLQAHQALLHQGEQAKVTGGKVIYSGVIEPSPCLPSSLGSRNPSAFLDKKFSVQEVREVLQGLGSGKASGHDDVPNECLKEAPSSFIHKLTILYNRVLEQSQVPRSWSRGRVVLVHKKG